MSCSLLPRSLRPDTYVPAKLVQKGLRDTRWLWCTSALSRRLAFSGVKPHTNLPRPSYAGLACVHSSLAMRTERTRDAADAAASQVEAWTLLALTLRGSIASGKEGPAGRRRQQRRAILYCSPPNYRGAAAAAAARCMPAHAPPLCSPAIPPRSGPPSLPPSLPRVGLPGQLCSYLRFRSTDGLRRGKPEQPSRAFLHLQRTHLTGLDILAG